MKHHRAISVSVAVLTIALSDRVAQAQPFRIVQIQPLPGASGVTVTDINNDLVAVGFSERVPVKWDRNGRPERLPVDVILPSLVINNHGVIAGSLGNASNPQPFLLRNGTDLERLPLRTDWYIRKLTDSGILLAGNRAIYLPLMLEFDAGVLDVSETGMTGGSHAIFAPNAPTSLVPFLRWPDGREVRPWPEQVGVTAVGPSGHFLGLTFAAPDQQSWTLFYGRPDGSVSRINERGCCVQIGRFNRAGDLVGSFRVHNTRDVVFLYRNGVFHDLTQWVTIPGRRILAAGRITDGGAILVATQQSVIGFGEVFLLIPTEPAPPLGLGSTVMGRVATVQWQPSVGADEYFLEVGSATGRSDLYNGSMGPHVSITTPAPPGRYYVRVRARNAVGFSAASAESIIDVP